MSTSNDENAINANGSIQSGESCRCFSLDDIQSMTNKFDDGLVIGMGRFGKVYIGLIDNGATTVAVKRLKAESNQGATEFWTEVEMLSKLQHTHLVALIGYCNDCQEKILVYEYMANGTLADHLYKVSRKGSGISIPHLTWEQRLDICIGVARGLDYLHTGTNQSFIHRDVKTTNILLDKKWVAKISDFGLSKGPSSHSITHVTTNVKGIFGYLDPDYFSTQRLTKKSDVFAFGVVLFEVLCGRPVMDRGLEEEQGNLVLWARGFIRKGKFDRIIDPSLSGQISPHCLKYLVEVANNCLHNRPKDRPTMDEVVRSLELALASQSKRINEGIITRVFQGIGVDHRWREKEDSETKSEPSKDSPWKQPSESTRVLRNFSFAEIRAATNDFNKSLLIGQGFSGNVYKGYIDGGTHVVAIKRLEKQNWLAWKQFKSEIEVRSLLCHLRIVYLIGCCKEENESILVFYYMANGSLQDHLYRADNDPLRWKKRLEICIDVARGLQHIHKDISTKQRVIHGHINSSNILFDENWVAKVTGFMCSKIPFTSGPMQHFDPISLVFGPGMMKTCDVHSFSYVLFEVLCAKKYSVPFVNSIEKGNIEIDPFLIGKIAPKCLTEFVNIASSCLFSHSRRPPSMVDVVRSLEYAWMLQEAWETRMKNGTELP